MKKICHIISAFDRHDTRILRKQCTSLVESGYDTFLIVNDSLKDEVLSGVRICTSGFIFRNRIQRILFAKQKSFKKALEINADVYQIHDPEFIPIGLKLKKKGKFIIYDSHEDFPRQILEKDWIPQCLRNTVSFLAELYLKKTLVKFDAIISVTPHIVDSLSLMIRERKVSLITNYPIVEDCFKDFSLEEYLSRENRMCYSGTVYRNSCQEKILESIKNIYLEYLLVGVIEPQYKEILSTHTAWGKVRFINKVSKSELLKFYNISTIGIVLLDYSPNLDYKRGSLGVNKIFEYMQSALPIICTDFELWKEIVDRYKCGIYVNPNNVEEIQNAISFLLENKQIAYEMGQNGRKAVVEEFNWDTQKPNYINIFKEFLI